jgi:hypothetical protein
MFQPSHGENKLHSIDDNDVRVALDQQALSDFYSASTLKQQSADRNVASLEQNFVIPSQPVFALSP